MKLIEILETCSDSINVNVYDLEDNFLAVYDGRDSIPQNLNNKPVKQIDVEKSILQIWTEV